MTISSPLWLAVMFGTVGIYWLLVEKLRAPFLIFATGLFLVLVDYRSFLLLFAFAIVTWSLLALQTRPAVIIALLIPTITIAYYKLQSNQDLLANIKGVAIPLGLSYFTFRVLHYVIERSRNNLAAHQFIDYFAYLFFLPTILIGPIHRFPQFLHDRQGLAWRAHQISAGVERILIGYFKVTVLGNFLLSNVASPWVASAHEYSPGLGYYLEAVRGSLNLYFQFAGFSDVAIGFSLMLGYRVMENFRSPFAQTNIADFWRCWHISLTSWSREYIFMTALSISRNPYLATLVSLISIGIWHEISWRYINWGLYHGLGILVCMQWGQFKRKKKLPSPKGPLAIKLVNSIKILATANFFFLSSVIVSQASFGDSLRVFSAIFIPWNK